MRRDMYPLCPLVYRALRPTQQQQGLPNQQQGRSSKESSDVPGLARRSNSTERQDSGGYQQKRPSAQANSASPTATAGGGNTGFGTGGISLGDAGCSRTSSVFRLGRDRRTSPRATEESSAFRRTVGTPLLPGPLLGVQTEYMFLNGISVLFADA